MPPVKFQVTTEGEKALLQMLQQAEAKADAAQRKLVEGGKKGKNVFDEMGKSAKDIAIHFTGVSSALDIVQKGSELIKQEWERINKLQQDSQRGMTSVGNARVDALRNASQSLASFGGYAGFDAMAERIAKTSKLDLASVYKMLSSGVSAKGEMSNAAFEDASNYAAHVGAQSGGTVDAAKLLGQGIDLAKVTGLPDVKANMGWLMQISSASRVVSSEGMGKLIAPIQAAIAMGGTPEWAASMEAAMSQTTGDSTGERSSTGFAAFLKALDKEVVPFKEASMSGKLETKYKRLEGKTPEEKAANLQELYRTSDEETRKDIKEKLGGEATTLAFYENFLQNNGKWKDTYAAATVAKPGMESANAAESFLGALKSGPYAQAVNRDLMVKQAEENRALNDPEGALRSSVKDRWEVAQKSLGRFSQYSNPYLLSTNPSPASVLENLQQQYANKEDWRPWAASGEKDQAVSSAIADIQKFMEEAATQLKESAAQLKDAAAAQNSGAGQLPALNQQEQ